MTPQVQVKLFCVIPKFFSCSVPRSDPVMCFYLYMYCTRHFLWSLLVVPQALYRSKVVPDSLYHHAKFDYIKVTYESQILRAKPYRLLATFHCNGLCSISGKLVSTFLMSKKQVRGTVRTKRKFWKHDKFDFFLLGTCKKRTAAQWRLTIFRASETHVFPEVASVQRFPFCKYPKSAPSTQKVFRPRS